MSDHIPRDVLAALAFGTISPEEIPPLLPHLVQCTACFVGVFSLLERGAPRVKEESVYNEAVGRAFTKARQAAQQARVERARAAKLLSRLERGGLSALPVIRQGWEIPLIEALLERSWALRHQDPAQMVELAELAVLSSHHLPAEIRSPAILADLRCRTGLVLGNAYRIVENLGEAERTFDRAMEDYLQGTQDRLLLARFLDLRSSLYRARRQLSAARQYLNLVYAIYHRYGEHHLAGRTLINMGILAGHAGESERALRLIEQGLALVDESRSEDLVFTGIHNQLWLLVDCGRIDEARKVLFLNRYRYEAVGGQLTRIKLQWLEARIDAGLGKLERAMDGFYAVKRELDGMGLRYDAALATFDLATAVMRAGRTGMAHDLVSEAAEVFIALRIHREALGAVVFLRETFTNRVSTVAVLEQVTAFLRRVQHDPSARFVPVVD